MRKVAIKMLLGDRAKYLGLVFGVTFATVLMAQQVSIFVGLMNRTASIIYNVTEADIWVMDTRVRYIEEVEPLRDVELTKVRSVPGVKWAVPFFKGLSSIRLRDGLTQQVQIIGIDDASLVGICPKTILGDVRSILQPQSALMDRNGYQFTWPGQEIKLGKEVELNDHRLVINGICKAKPTFFTFPLIYVTFDTIKEITPPQRNKMSFILVKAQDKNTIPALKERIAKYTDLQALTKDEFAWRSINYILERTGIPINFGITVTLGIIIGAAITAQTFYIFVIENLRQFGAMKAIGVTNGQLFQVVMIQAATVGAIGYSLGIGLTALFFFLTRNSPALEGFGLHWQIMLGSFIVISLIIMGSITFSLQKVFKLDPALVFRG